MRTIEQPTDPYKHEQRKSLQRKAAKAGDVSAAPFVAISSYLGGVIAGLFSNGNHVFGTALMITAWVCATENVYTVINQGSASQALFNFFGSFWIATSLLVAAVIAFMVEYFQTVGWESYKTESKSKDARGKFNWTGLMFFGLFLAIAEIVVFIYRCSVTGLDIYRIIQGVIIFLAFKIGYEHYHTPVKKSSSSPAPNIPGGQTYDA